MRVLVAPDEFAGTLSAPAAAAAIAAGWAQQAPSDELDLAPVSDGGPGFVQVLHTSLGGALHQLTVTGPMGTPVTAQFLLASGTAYLEAAQACGRHLVPDAARDPLRASSYGVGELLLAAVLSGARRVVVGLGGTASTDGGAGLLAALGARAWDRDRGECTELLRGGGAGLGAVARVDLGAASRRLAGVRLVAATDVDSPLTGPRGASQGFAPQKGASSDQVRVLEAALGQFATAIGRTEQGKDPALALGAGAGGGLGYGLLCLGATREPGISTVLSAISFPDRVAAADLVITGEGKFDWQSLRGKVVSGVAAAALEQARPCLVLAGEVSVGRRELAGTGVSATYESGPQPSDPAGQLAAAAARAAGTWSRVPPS